MKGAPKARKLNSLALTEQRKAKREKEELKKATELANATDDFIEALRFHMMGSSEACLTDEDKVDEYIRKLNITQARQVLRDNILIRVKQRLWVGKI